ncbi:galactokinase [Saitozyma podzolica]|uniref:Galactokinase n=1 Tax=Saitozyma podzolica TaxID=1890683 RepID=A0A427YS91_9TREE|nr:galactokinase [Saitozyma podzolica]
MAEQLPIPDFGSLAEIYPSQPAVLREATRWNDLVDKFKEHYGHAPSYVIRAPGRVNILGEHIDYSLFPVLPAAIEQDIILALTPTDEPTSSEAEWHVDFISPAQGGGWENYVKVATAECLEEFFKLGKSPSASAGKTPKGMKLLVSGTVPPGAGLSSSAAFVVGSVITFLVANGLTDGISKGDVVAMAMASEHRMGLRTGGMDQAASALCLSNTLLHLSFFPSLSPVPLPLPKSVGIVITNSLAPHDLTDTAPEQYNLRVVESLVAARLLLHAWGLSDHPRVKGKVEMWAPGESPVAVYEKALKDLESVLGKGGRAQKGWTTEEMIAESGMSKDEFTETYLHHFLEVRATHFHLYLRAKHALEESLRVARFSQLCNDISPDPLKPASIPEDDPRLKELGQLLIDSHTSCKDQYDCTHKQTDALKDLCLASGALGARQTGGGWGGAVISLVPISEAESFLNRVKKQYGPYQGLSDAKLDEAAFVTLPGSGAGVYVVNGDGDVRQSAA